MTRKFRLWAILLTLCALSSSLCAEAIRFDSVGRGQHDITFFLGFGANHKYPEATKDRFSLDLAKIRYGVFTSPRTQLSLSLAYGEQNGDQDNSSIWSTLGYRRYFLARGRTALGYDMSFGLMRFKNGMAELGTRTNFTEQLGLTLDYGINSSSSLTLEYLFSHTSNGGIKLPNIGINASMVALGYSWFR